MTVQASRRSFQSNFTVDFALAHAPECTNEAGQRFAPSTARFAWCEDRTEHGASPGIRESRHRYLTVWLSGPVIPRADTLLPLGFQQANMRFRQESEFKDWDELPEWLDPVVEMAQLAYTEFCARIAAG